MKAKLSGSLSGNLVVLAAVFAATTLFAADTTPPPGSSLEISRGTGSTAAIVKVGDPYDRVWVLQSSSNLATWTEVEALKIHNGSFARS